MTRSVRSHHYRRDGTIPRSLRPPQAILLPFSAGTFARSSSRAYMTGATTLVTAGSNVLRMEDRGDGHGPVPLLEGATENLLVHYRPNNFSNKNAVVINALAGTSLLDGRSQDTVDFGQSAPNHQIFHNPGTTYAADAYTGSIWIKLLSGTNTSQNFARNLSNEVGTILTSASPSDWSQQIATATFAGTEGIGQLVRDNSAETKTWIWDCHQLERRKFATSYVPVDGATASAVADQLTFASGVYPIDLVSGVWEFDFYPSYANDEVDSDVVLVSFGGADDELRFNATSDKYEFVSSGVSRGTSSAITSVAHEKHTLKIDMPAREITVTGASGGDGSFSLSSSDEWPSNVTLRIGGRQGGALESFGRYSEPRAA